jgi:hypothetical protein
VLPNGEAFEHCEFRFEFDPPLSVFEEHQIQVQESWSGTILPNGQVTLPRPQLLDPPTGRTPIIITSTGRSGTTLLMSEFARHPNIVVGDRFPYEIKQVAYYSAAFRALVSDADWVRSTHPETMLDGANSRVIGANPYNDQGFLDLVDQVDQRELRKFYDLGIPEGYALLFRKQILQFYAILANSQHKATAPFFCEKGDINEPARQGVRLFFDTVKEIVLVRDPRDLLCSAIAFWKMSPEKALAMLRATTAQIVSIARRAASDVLVIRYEDLLLDPVSSRRTIAEFVGLEFPLKPIEETAANFSGHGTSVDPASSIGRWRRDLSPDLITASEAAFEPYIREFGYELGATASRTPGVEKFGVLEKGDLIVIEGLEEVTSFLANPDYRSADWHSRKEILTLTFGREGNGAGFLREGWSDLEDGSIWTAGFESQIELPAIRQDGCYRLLIVGEPFTHKDRLPSQRLTLLLDGREVGTTLIHEYCLIAYTVPAVALTGRKIMLTLRLPDAAKPSELKNDLDTRLLGFSLRSVALFQLSAERIRLPTVGGCDVEQCANRIVRKRTVLLTSEWTHAGDDALSAILGKGWSRPEEWGVWGVGPAHELLLRIPAAGATGLELELDVHAALMGAHIAQEVDVVVADRIVSTWNFTAERNRGHRSVRIPDAVETTVSVPEEARTVTVIFRPRFFLSPNSLDSQNQDTRPLGLALNAARLRARSNEND